MTHRLLRKGLGLRKDRSILGDRASQDHEGVARHIRALTRQVISLLVPAVDRNQNQLFERTIESETHHLDPIAPRVPVERGAVSGLLGEVAQGSSFGETVAYDFTKQLKQIAQELGMALEDVRVISPFVGGGFGGKIYHPQVMEVVKIK